MSCKRRPASVSLYAILVAHVASKVPITFVAVSPISFTGGLKTKLTRTLAPVVFGVVVTFQAPDAKIASVDEGRHAGDHVVMPFVVIEINLLVGGGTLVDDGIGVIFGRYNYLVTGQSALELLNFFNPASSQGDSAYTCCVVQPFLMASHFWCFSSRALTVSMALAQHNSSWLMI